MACCRVAATFIASFLAFSVLLLLYCEVVHHYVVQIQCAWPEALSAGDVRVMVVSDTHLLGSRQGHWFDKLRREWQMHRSYVSALTLHHPDVVVFLGDLYDEGKWSDDVEFAETVARFDRLFPVHERPRRLVVAGNHDIGFHYSARSGLWRRFDAVYGTTGVSLTSLREDVHLVLINSVAMEGDGCQLCADATKRLKRVGDLLRCSEHDAQCPADAPRLPVYSRPILLQHFPLYRNSDADCQGVDSAPASARSSPFRPGWECISEDATQTILTLVKPRLVLSGHTHHYCRTEHGEDRGRPPVTEYSVPSFSWRNRNNPSYLMVRLDGSSERVSKCWMAEENTVVALYLVCLPAALVLSFVVTARRPLIRRWNGADAPHPRVRDEKHE